MPVLLIVTNSNYRRSLFEEVPSGYYPHYYTTHPAANSRTGLEFTSFLDKLQSIPPFRNNDGLSNMVPMAQMSFDQKPANLKLRFKSIQVDSSSHSQLRSSSIEVLLHGSDTRCSEFLAESSLKRKDSVELGEKFSVRRNLPGTRRELTRNSPGSNSLRSRLAANLFEVNLEISRKTNVWCTAIRDSNLAARTRRDAGSERRQLKEKPVDASPAVGKTPV